MEYFFQAGAPLYIENTKFGPVLIIFGYFVANVRAEIVRCCSKIGKYQVCYIVLAITQLFSQRGIPTASEYFYYERKVVGTNCPPSMPGTHELLSVLQKICKWFIILKVLSVHSLNPEIPKIVLSYKEGTQAPHQKMTKNKNDFPLRHHNSSNSINSSLRGILYPLCTLLILAVETGKAMYMQCKQC